MTSDFIGRSSQSHDLREHLSAFFFHEPEDYIATVLCWQIYVFVVNEWRVGP